MPREEALAIAVTMREALETKNKTVALVTPDRALARRVVSSLARWDVKVDDSGGDALADTGAGLFARLAAEVTRRGLEPVPLLALLKHPLLRLGHRQGRMIKRWPRLEQALLRGPRPRAGTIRPWRTRSRPSARRMTTCTQATRANRSTMTNSMPRLR